MLLDTAWTRACVDLTDVLPAPGTGDGTFQFAFVLRAGDEGRAFGGWHVDDVTAEVVTAGTSFIRGDADLSGFVRIEDAVLALQAVFGAAPLACRDAADANDDGRLDLGDGLYTLGYLFSGGPPPPAPFPGAGVDPSEDSLSCDGPPPPPAL
jgi:hypothetical protein